MESVWLGPKAFLLSGAHCSFDTAKQVIKRFQGKILVTLLQKKNNETISGENLDGSWFESLPR